MSDLNVKKWMLLLLLVHDHENTNPTVLIKYDFFCRIQYRLYLLNDYIPTIQYRLFLLKDDYIINPVPFDST